MTAWNPLDNYSPPLSHQGMSQPCFYYYAYPPNAFQSTTSCEQLSVIPPERKQSKRTITASLHSHNRSGRSYGASPSAFELSISIDDLQTTSRYRVHLHRSKTDRYPHAHRSSQALPLVRPSNESIDEQNRLRNSSSITEHYYVLKQQSKTITNKELIDVLNNLTSVMKNVSSNSQKQQLQQLPLLTDILEALLDVNATMLTSVSHNNFFTIVQSSLINILRQWRQRGSLTDVQSSTLHTTTKLLNILTDTSSLIPSWLSDSTLLDTIASCLTDIATQGKFLDDNNKQHFRHFAHLIATYILYQQRLDHHDQSNKDTFVQLLHPIQRCLASDHFIRAFTSLASHSTSLTASDKFFLLKCPAFLTSYNGSALEETMHSLLSAMVPQYVVMLGRVLGSSSEWSESTMRCVESLLSTIAHGVDQCAGNMKVIGEHVGLVDHVLQVVEKPVVRSNVRETMLVRSAMRLLVAVMGEPSVLSHLKERHAASTFLRLTSCGDEAVVLNACTLLAFATDEEDIQTLQKLDQLVATIIQFLRLSHIDKSTESDRTEELLEILKGLVQHDQVKAEISKQNVLPYLLDLTNTLTGKSLVLLYEILWSLTFFEGTARALRTNTDFLEKIEAISKDNSDGSLKRAVGGLVWTLLEEPAHIKRADAKHTTSTREKTARTYNDEQVAEATSEEDSAATTESTYQYDIMISYCHADKELTYRIYKFLVDQGFTVWIDLDNMHGPAMTAMADAVENSEFVIMCMSDAYKRSTYCQAEAEYAFNCKRKLIPLIMRPGYRPDGWLGFILGSRIYIDFGRYDFDTACSKLTNEISLHRKQRVSNVLGNLVAHVNPAEAIATLSKRASKNKKSPSEHPSKQSSVHNRERSSSIPSTQLNLDHTHKHIEQWTPTDVVNFLLSHQLDQIIPLCEKLNGRALMQMHRICATHRLQAYTIIKDELRSVHQGRISMNIYSRFLTVIEDAMKSSQMRRQRIEPAPVSVPPPPTLVNYPVIVPPIAFVPAPDLNRSYDYLITTDASPLDTLRMVEQYGSQLGIVDYLRHTIANVY